MGSRATAMDLAFLDPLRELLDNAEAVVRGFFSNSNVTVNLIPAILAGLGALLFLLPLIGIPILDIIFGAMTGASTGAGYSSNVSYGASTTGAGYAAPSSGYGAYSASRLRTFRQVKRAFESRSTSTQRDLRTESMLL